MGRLLLAWGHLRGSLWLVPGVMSLLGGAMAVAALSADLWLQRDGVSLWWLHSGNAADASRLLATLVTAIITMTALALSITMVVLTLAANQLGPRLIRSFVDDRRTQLALGVFIGTIVYLLLVLRAINGGMSDAELPRLAVTGGSALTLTSVLMLLFFVHHLSRAIVADTVIQRVGDQLDRAVAAYWPAVARGEHDVADLAGPILVPDRAVIGFEATGYVQAIDMTGLVQAAKAAGATLRLDVRQGHHVLRGGRHMEVSPAQAATGELREAVCRAVEIGMERTPLQDVEFAARQLVEIALRALSPSINDPFTAIAVIDRLGAAIALLPVDADAPGRVRDRDGRVRLVYPRVDFEGLVDTAFNQIRQAAEAKPDVLIALMDTLAALGERKLPASRRSVLRRHVRVVAAAGRRHVTEPSDLADVEARERRALGVLAE